MGLLGDTIGVASGLPLAVDLMARGHCVLRLSYRADQLRAGGTISGPVMFTIADAALYGAVLSEIGMQPLAVTTDLSIHFVRKPPQADLVAEARLLKCGRRLAVGTVEIRSAAKGEVVAHATGTYALP